MSPGQAAFTQRLRNARERRGLSIQDIAVPMKIKVSLLAALERGDVRYWPAGIFRRAFFRGYVSALGFDPEPILHEFLQLFPEDPPLTVDASRPESRHLLAAGRTWTAAAARQIRTTVARMCAVVTRFVAQTVWKARGTIRAPTVEVDAAAARSETLRLTLAGGRTWTVAAVARGVCATAADVCGAVTIGGLVAQTGYIDFWTASALTGATYYMVSTAAVGRSAIAWWIDRRAIRRRPKLVTPGRLWIAAPPPPRAVSREAAVEERPLSTLRATSG